MIKCNITPVLQLLPFASSSKIGLLKSSSPYRKIRWRNKRRWRCIIPLPTIEIFLLLLSPISPDRLRLNAISRPLFTSCPGDQLSPNHHRTLLLLLLLVGCSVQSSWWIVESRDAGKKCRDWIGEREAKVNPQSQIGGQSILPILFYAVIKIELHEES